MQAPPEGVAHVGGGVRAEALRVGHAVQRERAPSPAAASPFDLSFSTGPQPLVIDVQVRSLEVVRSVGAACVAGRDPADRAAVEVDVVEVAVGPELEVDRVGGARDERVDLPGDGIGSPFFFITQMQSRE